MTYVDECSVGEKDAAIEELRQKLVIVNEDISSSHVSLIYIFVTLPGVFVSSLVGVFVSVVRNYPPATLRAGVRRRAANAMRGGGGEKSVLTAHCPA